MQGRVTVVRRQGSRVGWVAEEQYPKIVSKVSSRTSAQRKSWPVESVGTESYADGKLRL